MARTDLFSKRHKEMPDVFEYDQIPTKLRQQIVYWLDEFLPAEMLFENQYRLGTKGESLYAEIRKALCTEHGLARLYAAPALKMSTQPSRDEVCAFIIEKKEQEFVDCILDLVELACRQFIATNVRSATGSQPNKADAIEELNSRFRENGIGYEFNWDAKQLIRYDNTVLHRHVTQPALHLLTNPIYQSANVEFLNAFEDYKKGDYSDCILKCCQAQESVMKIICASKGWIADPAKTTAKPLIDTIVSRAALDTYLIEALYATAKLRNDYAGHGAGTKPPKAAPAYLARYCLTSTASNTLYLVESTK